jgi:uncharacterized protein YjiS (DUF1127 family)
MNLTHRLAQTIAAKRHERATTFALSRLADGQLADLGLAREDIRPVARLAAREAVSGRDAPVAAILSRLNEDPAAARAAEGPARFALKRGATAARALTAMLTGWERGTARALTTYGAVSWGVREQR